MLTQSDIDSLDLAHTHAQSVKKKTALETVFISLYAKYNAGGKLSKVEEKTIKDYLMVYRSEFAMLKRKAKLQSNLDKNEQQKILEKKLEKRQKAILFENAHLDFLEKAKALRKLEGISLNPVIEFFYVMFGVVSYRSAKKYISMRTYTAKYIGFTFYASSKLSAFINLVTIRYNDKKLTIPLIVYFDKVTNLKTYYLSNFTTPKWVVDEIFDVEIALADEDLKIKLQEVKSSYENCSNEWVYLDKNILISSLKLDENLVYFIVL